MWFFFLSCTNITSNYQYCYAREYRIKLSVKNKLFEKKEALFIFFIISTGTVMYQYCYLQRSTVILLMMVYSTSCWYQIKCPHKDKGCIFDLQHKYQKVPSFQPSLSGLYLSKLVKSDFEVKESNVEITNKRLEDGKNDKSRSIKLSHIEEKMIINAVLQKLWYRARLSECFWLEN